MQPPHLQVIPPLDRPQQDPKNEDMAKWAGRRVRDWRLKQGVSQREFAARAHISVGALQAFESGIRQTRETTTAKIAAVLGLTSEQLISVDEWPVAEVLRDLRQEDLEIARHYHHAGAHTKYAIKALFEFKVTDTLRERLARVVEALLRDQQTLKDFEVLLETKGDAGKPGL